MSTTMILSSHRFVTGADTDDEFAEWEQVLEAELEEFELDAEWLREW